MTLYNGHMKILTGPNASGMSVPQTGMCINLY